MGVKEHLYPVLSNPKYTFLLLFTIGLIPRLAIWTVIPVDWNPDSFHHWQISYLTLKIGLRQGRLWDLNGCECYWGVVPHIVNAIIMGVLSTPSILPYRILNLILGSANSYLIYIVGRDNIYWRVGFLASLAYALYPIAGVFDIVALQESMALFFALLSLALFNSKPGWSGGLLALAAQSRTEFWLVSIFFVVGVALIERCSERAQAFSLSWLTMMGVFCLLFRNWTSNPIYPLYWSLFNVFGGWTEQGRGLPIHQLMVSWAGEKLRAWPTKPTGQVLLGSAFTLSGSFIHMFRSRWRNYQLSLFFLISVVVFGPIFLTYYPDQSKHFLYMLRMSLPIVASGSILLASLLYRALLRLPGSLQKKLPLEGIIVALMLVPYGSLIPAYGRFQTGTLVAFTVADEAIDHYRGGTIVCDNPTVNYRLVSKWGVRASSLLGNHYSPHYYGVTEPTEYARWFDDHNVTLWLHCGWDAEPVWRVMDAGLPRLLTLQETVHGVRIYRVNQTVLGAILSP
ncbi:MAG: hypothetical protein PVJ38_01130 [Candidatus Bathyarchaeota archaeon]|jgi:hypothetical protein